MPPNKENIKKNIKVVDWGTSKVVSGEFLHNYDWEDTHEGIIFLGTENFEQKLGMLVDNVHDADVVGLTGLSHSLAPVLKNGTFRAALIGDEPSLTPKNGMPEYLKMHYPEETTRPISAVRKLAGLLEHPELMTVLFGDNLDGEVGYSSLLSLAAWRILGQPERLDIFPDEAMDFVNGEVSKPTNEELIDRFKLQHGQLVLGSESIQRVGKKEVWVMQDIRADFRVISELFERHLLSEDTWLMNTDSVLKRVRLKPDFRTSSLEGLYYDTMRMMGNTGVRGCGRL